MFVWIAGLVGVVVLVWVVRQRRRHGADWAQGYKHKVCALLGVELESFKKLRWQEHRASDTLRSTTVVFAWAGGAVRIGGVPRAEFVRTLSDMHCDVVFLVDEKQKFYCGDPAQEAELRARIQQHSRQYHRVVFVGSCMGGAAALRFADLADCVLSFIPPVDLRLSAGFFWYWLGGLRLPSRVRATFTDAIAKAVAASKGQVHCYFAADVPRWCRQAAVLEQSVQAHLANASPLHLHLVHGCSSPVQHFKQGGQLTPLLHAAVTDQMPNE